MERLRDYGHSGLIGVLTPQANTTVEPEFWALLPPRWSMLNARLTSDYDTIEERLIDYTTKFSETSERFANAPIEAITVACTGSSYLMGLETEARIVAEIQEKRGVPCITAALASVEALRALDANRIGILSPYPEKLNLVSTKYWEAQGFEIVAEHCPAVENGSFHPIYSIPGARVLRAYEALSRLDVDAVLMLGTGMPTIGPILAGLHSSLRPAISCNLALVWSACRTVCPKNLVLSRIESWIEAKHWSRRARVMFPNLF